MASTIDPTVSGDMTEDGRSVDKSNLQAELQAAANDIDALQGVSLTPGTGTDGAAVNTSQIVSVAGGIIHTQIFVDLTDLTVDDALADIVGEDDAANCHFGQYTAAVMGTLVGGQITCLETPAGANLDDLDFASADEATGTEGAASGTGALSNVVTLYARAGSWAINDVRAMTGLPSANQYIYIAAGDTGGDSSAFTAGKFLIEFWGTP